MTKVVPIHELIKVLVPSQVSKEDPRPVYFKHDSPLALAGELAIMDASSTLKYQKYPLVALLHDFEENMNSQVGMYAEAPNLNILIVNYTEREYDSDTRYAKNYVPVLYPIYEQLITNIEKSGLFMVEKGGVKHTKIDRLFWGRYGVYGREGNIFNDYLDVLEIKKLKLLITQNCYKTWQNLIQLNAARRAAETQA